MLFFIALGGAAVLEVHRALHKESSGDADVDALRDRERALKQALETAQKELHQEKEQRQRVQTKAESLASNNKDLQSKADSLAANNKDLQSKAEGLVANNKDLQSQAATLRAEKAALEDQSKLLLRRFQALEESAADLQSTNADLLQQVESLKLESDAEVVKTMAQVDELKKEVAAAVQAWAEGDVSADAFISTMSDLGVEVHVKPGSLPALPAPDMLASNQLQLTMGDAWTSKMQLVTESKERMSRLLTAAAARQQGLPPRNGAAAITFPAAKTPPRDAGMSRRLEMGSFSMSGLTPRKSNPASQGVLDVPAAVDAALSQPPAPQAERPALQAIENTAPAAAMQPAPASGWFSKPKGGDKKAAGKRQGGKTALPKLEFATFDSDDFVSSSNRGLMRL